MLVVVTILARGLFFKSIAGSASYVDPYFSIFCIFQESKRKRELPLFIYQKGRPQISFRLRFWLKKFIVEDDGSLFQVLGCKPTKPFF